MAKRISDEIRELIDDEDLYPRQIAGLRRIADRIDSEMVELPKDKDGRPIHVGNKVYLDDGHMACVTEIDIHDNHVVVDCWDGSKHMACHPSDISRTRPDSWERIADELEGLSVDSMISDTNLLSSCALDLAKRIRRLAEREGKR